MAKPHIAPMTHPMAASLSERAYLLIREGILRGEYSLGSPLSRRKLALQYGMSFLPISDAIQRLEQEGLVESKPRVGTRVRIPTAQDVRDCYILREALECQAARLFAEKASSHERLELRAMAKQVDTLMKQASEENPNQDLAFQAQGYHLSFHMRIAECTGCSVLRSAIERNQTLTFNWLYDITATVPLPPRRHERLMQRLVRGDPQIAEAAMREHIRYGLSEIQAAISSRFSAGMIRVKNPESPQLSTMSGVQRKVSWRVKTGHRL
jgi:GntR family transcriptional regulator, rspAB operon transcriptional repressor